MKPTYLFFLLLLGKGKSTPPKLHAVDYTPRPVYMKIKITIEHTAVLATLFDNPTARDFATLLPLRCRVDDLFGREKYGNLPRALSTNSKRQNTYHAGDIGYWSPGTDIAIYYKEDHETIPNPGIIIIGKIDSNVEAFELDGSAQLTIELNRP